MKLLNKSLLSFIFIVVLIINNVPLALKTQVNAQENDITIEQLDKMEGFNVFDCEDADVNMGFFPTASKSVKFSYSRTEDTFNQGTRSVKVFPTGNAAPADEIASMYWHMYQREGYGNTSDWRGGEYLSLWVKNDSANEVNISYIDFYEGTFGPLTPIEPWRLSGDYYIQENGALLKINNNGKITLPANYKGKIFIPFNSFSVPSWYTAGDGILDLFRIVRAEIGFVSLSGQSFPSTLYLDSLCVLGKDVLQVDTLDTSSLEEMQLYGFESVDYELPTLSFDAKFADKSFIEHIYEAQGAFLGEYSLAVKNILKNQSDGLNQFGGFGLSLYNQGEGDGVSGKNFGNWTGAQYVGFWINNTNTTNVSFTLQCYENAPEGQPYQATKCYQLSGFSGATKNINYYTTNWHLVSEDGTIITLAQNDFYIPAGFKGKVYIPLNTANFEIPTWQTGYEQPNELKLDRMARIGITFQPVNNSSMGIDKIYFDNIFVAGKTLSELEINSDSIFGNSNAKFSLSGDILPKGVYSSDLVTQFTILDEFDEDNIATQAITGKLGYNFLTSYKFNVLDKSLKSVAFNKALTVSFIKPANLGANTKMFLFSDNKLSEIDYIVNNNETITASLDKLGIFVFADVLEKTQLDDDNNPSTSDFMPEYLITSIALSLLLFSLVVKKHNSKNIKKEVTK